MKREDEERLIPVYDAPTEDAGRMVAALIEHNGISAFFKERSGAAFDGVEAIWSGHESGKVYVLADDEARAAELVRDYLASLDDDGASADTSPA